jgi:hypothetical protein
MPLRAAERTFAEAIEPYGRARRRAAPTAIERGGQS